MRHVERQAFFSCAPMTNNSSVKTLPPNLAHVSALYAITPPIVGGLGALIPLAEWRHRIKPAGLLDILLCIVALTGNRHYSSAIQSEY